MQLEAGYYYHLFNRSNNHEIAFKSAENYLYFLRQYRKQLNLLVETFAYCLMPTHFHFLIRVQCQDNQISSLKQRIGIWQSAYTKALNKQIGRHGSLFQHHAKANEIRGERQLLATIAYIHQNPVRAKLTKRIEDWAYSSYPDLGGFRDGTLPSRTLRDTYFANLEAFRQFSQQAYAELDSTSEVESNESVSTPATRFCRCSNSPPSGGAPRPPRPVAARCR